MKDVVRLKQVAEKWKTHGVETVPGASTAALQAFERQHQVRLPADVVVYFQILGGMKDGFFDEDWFYFLPLESVRRLSVICPNTSRANDLFIIVDVSVGLMRYAIDLNGHEGGAVFAVPECDLFRVANSWGEFLDAYCRNEQSLFAFG